MTNGSVTGDVLTPRSDLLRLDLSIQETLRVNTMEPSCLNVLNSPGSSRPQESDLGVSTSPVTLPFACRRARSACVNFHFPSMRATSS